MRRFPTREPGPRWEKHDGSDWLAMRAGLHLPIEFLQDLGLGSARKLYLGQESAAAHLRPGRHVRGCHVLDWITGRG
jgi:hypothetical protein